MRGLAAILLILLTPGATLLSAGEADAVAISVNIRARHMPYGGVLDPIFSAPNSNDIVGYTRCGDSALWTGAYLAAESFRYSVTRSAVALDNVKFSLAALKGHSDVTGDNRLARCMVPADSPYAAGIAREEAANTIHQNPPWIWVDNTSRDQIVGAFFGLAAAYDLVDDPWVRQTCSDLATRLIGYISRHQWSPNDDLSSTFQLRPEELQMLLQVARHLNPSNGVSGPFFVAPVKSAVLVDTLSNSSYFKFSLDYMTFYNLVRLQDNDDNRSAYQVVRSYTASHQNPFFNLIDRALRGSDVARDAETRTLLDQWLQRPRRDVKVDVSNLVQVCMNSACQPVPVPMRPTTDFLWQRDPFQLAGGGDGFIENPGIDYILPYWMARYYGVIAGNTVQPSAAPAGSIAPGSLASIYGTALASTTAQAPSMPLPVSLGGVTLAVTDSTGILRFASLLYVSPTQINFLVPDVVSAGAASIRVINDALSVDVGASVAAVSPTLFSMNGAGSGVAAATAVTVQVANPALQSPVPVFQCTASGCASVPIQLGVDTPIYVSLYGTGIRNRSSINNVGVTINGVTAPVLYAGAAPAYPGLDQVNVLLPLTLRGAGESNVVLTVDGVKSNVVTLNVR